MPIVHHSDYKPPVWMRNRHLLTIYPTLCRRVKRVQYTRARMTMPDGDFVDLDFSAVGSDLLVLVLHGLEGDAHRKYVKGMVQLFNQQGYDVAGMNFRGCSGEPNKALRFYHSGETADLDAVVQHVAASRKYKALYLVGFSLGGNVALKYTGEQGKNIHPLVHATVAISVPIDLANSAIELEKKHNAIYMQRFIRSLGAKLKAKQALYPDAINLEGYENITTFRQFDDRYTAPLHGFPDADTYWYQSSAIRVLDQVAIPTLLINAQDDSFLGPKCFPYEMAEHHPLFYLETPRYGGHVGFVNFGVSSYWTERRALDFIRSHP
ncbi:alpha/beta hydrolase [Chitinophaga parva]|uniref:Alpha/beta hydrolase n=2 Tax=Chitinophaga parva TaxID=2169414 RepID=A0A2T7BPV8_9BACT|nr:alpha/beta hydrolase [Chitinophaga parva]